LNFANFLTCSRVVLAAIFTAFLFSSHPFGKLLALFVFIAAAVTDYWDGKIARSLGEISPFGQLMDPLADKILTLAAFFSFWRLGLLPLWMALVVVLRDILVTVARLFMPRDSENRSARQSGKQKTFFQILYIVAVLLYLIARQVPEWQPSWDERAIFFTRAGMWLILLLTVWSGVRVFMKNKSYE